MFEEKILSFEKFGDGGYEARVEALGRNRPLVPRANRGLELTGKEWLRWGKGESGQNELAVAYTVLCEALGNESVAEMYASLYRDQQVANWPEIDGKMRIDTAFVCMWLIGQIARQANGEPTPASLRVELGE